MKRRAIAALLAAPLMTSMTVSLTLLSSSPAVADGYPSEPITLICPYSAGGGGDTASRMIAKVASDIMGVPVNVENKTGGGATIGINAVAKAKADGYTIGFVSTSPITIRPHMTNPPYDPMKDLSYIGQFVASNQPLVVKSDSPHQSLADLIAYGKANPGKLRWSTSVQRGGPHLAVAAMFNAEEVDATYVPFKGGSKVLAALLGDTIDAAMIAEGSKATLDGQTRILAEGTPNKNPVTPDAPVLTDAGYPIAPAIFFGLAGPAGLPDDVISKWDEVLEQVVASDEFKALAEQRKWTLDFAPSAAFTEIVQADFESAKKAVEAVGME